MRKALLIGLLAAVAAGAWVGLTQWSSYVAARNDDQLYRTAATLLATGKVAAAAEVIRSRPTGQNTSAGTSRRWRDLQVATAALLRQVPQLLAIEARWPESIAANEDASLLVARVRLDSGHYEEANKLMAKWTNRSGQPQVWFALEVDALLAQKKRSAALALLQSRSFAGPADCGRLLRLALLSVNDLPAAWKYLDQAYALDPRNTDVRSFRAQILERIGKRPLARVEYVAAYVAAPSNPMLGDQLAEFYRRGGDYDDALDTWAGESSKPLFDFIWTKAWFWSHVVRPTKLAAPRGDELGALVKLEAGLPPNTFWNAARFAATAPARGYPGQQQEIYWLGLLEMLRHHDEKGAAEALRLNPPGTQSWAPDLETALRHILSYRADGVLNPRNQPMLTLSAPADQLHPFFVELDDLAHAERTGGPVMPPEMARLLHGDAAFAAAMLATGWSEAALRLSTPDEKCDGLPGWFAYGYIQALRVNRGNEPALAFAQKQPGTPELNLLTGELQSAEGKAAEGRQTLLPLATLDSDVGYRAAWLLGMAALAHGQPQEAARLVNAQPRLLTSVTGREMLARVALAEGREEDADKVYGALAPDSAEAKAYLARRAFAHHDWIEARRYTDELLVLFPDQLELRANLNAIDRAEHPRS
jgi:predicted Zn-dependent protease